MHNEFFKNTLINAMSDADYSKSMDYIEYRTWCVEKDRTLFVNGSINGEEDDSCSTQDIILNIQRYNRIDDENGVEPSKRQPIIMFIDSIGGDAYGTYTLIRVMEESKTPIYTVNAGEASSAAGIILIHGHKRFAYPGTKTMVHSGSFGLYGNAEQAESAKKTIDKLRKRLEDTILSHTKITKKDYNKYAPKDWYFFDEEQLEYGIVDAITSDVHRIYNGETEENNVAKK